MEQTSAANELTWQSQLASEKNLDYFQQIISEVNNQRSSGKVIYPSSENIFNAMTYTELEKAMDNNQDPNYKKYLEIRKKNLHKIQPIPVCKFNES